MPGKVAPKFTSFVHQLLCWHDRAARTFCTHIWNETVLGGYLRSIVHNSRHYAALPPSRIKCLSSQVVNALPARLFKAIPADHFSLEQCQKMGKEQLRYLMQSGNLQKVASRLPSKKVTFALAQPTMALTIVPLLEKETLEKILKSRPKLENEIKSGLSCDSQRIISCWQKFIGKRPLNPTVSKIDALMLQLFLTQTPRELIPTLSVDQLRTILSASPSATLIKMLACYLNPQTLFDLIRSATSIEDPCFKGLCEISSQIDRPLSAFLLSEQLDASLLAFLLQFPSCAFLLEAMTPEKLIAYLTEAKEEALLPFHAQTLSNGQWIALFANDSLGEKCAKLLSYLPRERLYALACALTWKPEVLNSAFLPRLFHFYRSLDQQLLVTSLLARWADQQLIDALKEEWSGQLANFIPPERLAQLICTLGAQLDPPLAQFLSTLPLDYANRILPALTTIEALLSWYKCLKSHPQFLEMLPHLHHSQLQLLFASRHCPEAAELLALTFGAKEDTLFIFQNLTAQPCDLPLNLQLCRNLSKYSDMKLQQLFAYCPQPFIEAAIAQLKQMPDPRVENLLIRYHPSTQHYLENGRMAIEQRAWLFERWIAVHPHVLPGLLYQLNDPLELLAHCKPLATPVLRLLTQHTHHPRYHEVQRQLVIAADKARHPNIIRLIPLFGATIPHRHQLPLAISTMAYSQIMSALQQHCHLNPLLETELIATAQQILAKDNLEWFWQLEALVESHGPIQDSFWQEYLRERPLADIDGRLLAAFLLKMAPQSHGALFHELEMKEGARSSLVETMFRIALLLNQYDDDTLTAFLQTLKRKGYTFDEYLPQFSNTPHHFSTSSQKVLKALWEEHSTFLAEWETSMAGKEHALHKLETLMGSTPFKHLHFDQAQKAQNLIKKCMPNLTKECRAPFLGLLFLTRTQKLLALPENEANAPSGWTINPLRLWHWNSTAMTAKKVKELEPTAAARLQAFDSFYEARLKEQQERPADPDEAIFDIHGLLEQRGIKWNGSTLKYIWKEFTLSESQKQCLGEHLSEIRDLKHCCNLTASDSVDSMLEKIVAYTLKHSRHL